MADPLNNAARRYTPAQAAQLTGWDVQTIRQLLRNKELDGDRVGFRWYITELGLEQLRHR
ncbi:hypothetical protein ACIA49_39050 [Kribbella sp. NPDC051587]|uniref:hypothetical protein n=1 Tax=Kribbella sp. NPDC051587 TaxID=3364119 RepID=UPI00379E35D5